MAKAGLPGIYIKRARKLLPRSKMSAVMKKAWSLSRRKKKSSRPRKTTRKRASSPKKRGDRMAKRKRKRATKTVPLAPLIGMIGGACAPTSSNPSGLIKYLQTGNWEAALNVTCTNFTGIVPHTGKWKPQDMHAVQGLILGLIVHKVAGWLGAGRVFAKMPSPLNRLRI